jgi:hypothetical protein
MNEDLKQILIHIHSLLAACKYHELENLTGGNRLSAQEVAKAIADYGKHLVVPPDSFFGLTSVVEVKDSFPKRFSVVSPLWTLEEGRSDLSLEMTAIQNENGFTVELDNIHVL